MDSSGGIKSDPSPLEAQMERKVLKYLAQLVLGMRTLFEGHRISEVSMVMEMVRNCRRVGKPIQERL